MNALFVEFEERRGRIVKKSMFSLIGILIVTIVIVGCIGGYLKYEVLKPLDLYQDKNVMTIPFLLMEDPAAGYTLQRRAEQELLPPETVPAVTEPPITIAAATVPQTEPETQPPTEPESLQLEESWFDDALFIGNSLTNGLRDFARLGKADYFSRIGLTLYDVQEVWEKDISFGYTQLPELLQSKTYGKVYIGLGLNECGYPIEDVQVLYQDLINLIQEHQPDALIVLQGVMTVGKAKAQQGWYFNPENIFAFNEMVEGLADGDKIRYIDVNEWVAGEDGYMISGFSSDGCHPYLEGYEQWAQWILEKSGTFGIP